jgi:hypothetical protein
MSRGDTRIRCLWICHTSLRVAIYPGLSVYKKERKLGKAIVSAARLTLEWFALDPSPSPKVPNRKGGGSHHHVAALRARPDAPSWRPCPYRTLTTALSSSPSLNRRPKTKIWSPGPSHKRVSDHLWTDPRVSLSFGKWVYNLHEFIF